MNWTPTTEYLKSKGFKEKPMVALETGFYQDYVLRLNSECMIVATKRVFRITDYTFEIEMETDYLSLSISSPSDLETLIKILK